MADATQAIGELKRLLVVEELDTDFYRGAFTPQMSGRVFGGQVIAQALASALGSVGPERVVHSLHAYFLRAGDNERPIIYRVIRDFDGNSFANRRVVALQDGKPILNLAASFHRQEPGLTHMARMPEVPDPEHATPMARVLIERGARIPAAMAGLLSAFDMRVGPPDTQGDGPRGMPNQHSWFRLAPSLGPDLARITLAYASDFALVTTALLPHGVQWFSPAIQGASLDHAVWFHEDPPLDEWLLYAMESPWSGQARGFSRGSVYDRSGRLIASMAQEGLMRHRPES
ncbi:acyl-CoA thioesterase [Novosphingobium sp. M1R2S20]|uniref:Acyl-CoA thioesterase n=1 Tax=Novosphingobium rhizovicinum TaxID=3228928 RepID=A0ABV3RF80_9SPHN